MNICYISREYVGLKRAGGIATYVNEISKIMSKMGHNVYVISASDHITRNERKKIDGINLIMLSGVDYYLHPNRYVQFVLTKFREYFFFNSYRRKIAKTVKDLDSEIGLDLLEFPEFGNEAKYWLINKTRRVPTVVRFHGIAKMTWKRTYIDLDKRQIKNLIKTAFSADGISFPSYAIMELLHNTVGYPSELLACYRLPKKVVANPLLLKEREVKELNTGKFIFTAGSFVSTKGFGELIEAVKRINEGGIKINLIVAGKLGKLGVLYKKKELNDATYQPWLKVLGPIKRDNIFSYYKNAELCCFPSYWDNMPLTCLEAMSVKGLVLGSNSGGMGEIIDEGVDGFLVKPKKVNLLIDRIVYILNLDDNKKNIIRNNAQNKILEKYSEHLIGQEMLKFYDEVIAVYRKMHK